MLKPVVGEGERAAAEAASRRGMILRGLIGLALAVGGMAWALRGVNLSQVAQLFREIHPLAVAAAFGCSVMVALLKAARWRWLYYPQHRRLAYGPVFSTLLIAQMVNNVSPIRVGEIVRILLINRRTGVGKATTLSTIVAEKALDLLCLSAIVLLTLALSREWAAVRLGLALVTAGGLALAGLGWRRRWLTPWFERLVRLAPARWQGRIMRTIHATLAAFEPLSEPQALGPVIGMTVVIWALSALSFYAALQAFGLHLSWTVAVALLAALQGAVSIPSSPPGYVGVIEAASGWVLQAHYGVVPSVAFSASLLIHLIVVGPVLVLGGICLWLTAAELPGLLELRRGGSMVAEAEAEDVVATP